MPLASNDHPHTSFTLYLTLSKVSLTQVQIQQRVKLISSQIKSWKTELSNTFTSGRMQVLM